LAKQSKSERKIRTKKEIRGRNKNIKIASGRKKETKKGKEKEKEKEKRIQPDNMRQIANMIKVKAKNYVCSK